MSKCHAKHFHGSYVTMDYLLKFQLRNLQSQEIRKHASLSPMNMLFGQTKSGPRFILKTNLSIALLVLMENDSSDEELAEFVECVKKT